MVDSKYAMNVLAKQLKGNYSTPTNPSQMLATTLSVPRSA
jgi:hypothetical protein